MQLSCQSLFCISVPNSTPPQPKPLFPHAQFIVCVWLAERMPREITWFGTWDLLAVEREATLFHLIISYLLVCSFLRINENYYLHLAVTALSTPQWLHFIQVTELWSNWISIHNRKIHPWNIYKLRGSNQAGASVFLCGQCFAGCYETQTLLPSPVLMKWNFIRFFQSQALVAPSFKVTDTIEKHRFRN